MKSAMYFAYAAAVLVILAGIIFAFIGHPEFILINTIAGGACFFAADICRTELKLRK